MDRRCLVRFALVRRGDVVVVVALMSLGRWGTVVLMDGHVQCSVESRSSVATEIEKHSSFVAACLLAAMEVQRRMTARRQLVEAVEVVLAELVVVAEERVDLASKVEVVAKVTTDLEKILRELVPAAQLGLEQESARPLAALAASKV